MNEQLTMDERLKAAELKYAEFLQRATSGQRPVSGPAVPQFLAHLHDLEARLFEISEIVGGK